MDRVDPLASPEEDMAFPEKLRDANNEKKKCKTNARKQKGVKFREKNTESQTDFFSSGGWGGFIEKN